MRNAKAYNSRVKAEAVRMPVLGGVKRKRDAEDAGDKLREASKATNAMLKVAGELLLEEGTEDACHAITDRFGRCVLLPAIYKLRGIHDPEDPDYEFVYCPKHFKMFKDPDMWAAQIARVGRCLASARAVEEPVVPFNPFLGGGAVRELAGPVAPVANAQAVASNPFLVPAQVFASKAAAPADNLAIMLANLDLAK